MQFPRAPRPSPAKIGGPVRSFFCVVMILIASNFVLLIRKRSPFSNNSAFFWLGLLPGFPHRFANVTGAHATFGSHLCQIEDTARVVEIANEGTHVPWQRTGIVERLLHHSTAIRAPLWSRHGISPNLKDVLKTGIALRQLKQKHQRRYTRLLLRRQSRQVA